ncbi:hypothetical protein [Nostoc sp.]|uniref:hypothetical protein n=1 Tax=Nostoc sp. TaxID=1180 RepID=UPI002FF9DBD9
MFNALLTEENITSLMSPLDDEQNLNLFYIVDFLNLYYYYLRDTDSSTKHNIMSLYGELIKKVRLEGKEYKRDLEEQFKKIMSLYGELIRKIKREGEYYKREVEKQLQKSHQGLDSKDSDKIPNHTEIIDKFKILNSPEQKNLKYLSWYLLHKKIINNLDRSDPNRTSPIWKLYSQLIKDIKSLPINE